MNGTWIRHMRVPLGLVVGVALVIALVPAIGLLGASSGTVGPSIPLLFLMPVVITSVFSGRAAGAGVAFCAVFSWDWFFITPRYTISISDPRDLIGLLVFLVVAILTGQLATAVRRQGEEAMQRAAVAEALYDLSQVLISSHNTEDALSSLTDRLVDAFPLEASAVLVPTSSSWRTAVTSGTLPEGLQVERNRDACATASWVMRERRRASLQRSNVHFLPLQAGNRAVGVLELIFRPHEALDGERERQISTFANGAALVIDSARLAQEEQQAILARESDALKTALLSSVSHDLRTPLAGIKAAASSLLSRDIEWRAEDRDAFAADIDSEADRLTRLVSNMLDVSRIEAGVLQPAAHLENVDELMNRTLDRMVPLLADRAVRCSVQEQLPPVCIDPVQIEQVLINLLENAAKYSPPGTGIELFARTYSQDAAFVHISVLDHGPGIPSEERIRVFDKFYSVSGAGRPKHGTGIGLAIVHGLVLAHGGAVWTDETPGGGSTFSFTLPVAPGSALHPAPDPVLQKQLA